MHAISQLHEEITRDFSFWVLSSLHYYIQQLQAYVHIHIFYTMSPNGHFRDNRHM